MDSNVVIPAYYLSAGVLLYTGIQTAMLCLFDRQPRFHLAFVVCCFCAAGYQIGTALYYSAETIPTAAKALHGQVAFLLAFFPPFAMYVTRRTGQTHIERWSGLVLLMFAILLSANLLSPYSLRFDTLESALPLNLPGGELPVRFTGRAGLGNIVVRLICSGILLGAVVQAAIQYRSGERRSGLLLAACIGLMFACGLWEWAIDFRRIDSFYLSGFGFLGFVVLQSVSEAHAFCNRSRRLEAVGAQLQDEIERRRKAEQIIGELRSGVSSFTGTVFFDQLVKCLAVHFEADYAFVGLLDGPGQKSVSTLALWAQNALGENLTYPLANTPCADVAGQCTRVYSCNVRELFPDDALAHAWSVESYVGTPFFDSEGTPLGIVVVASKRPLQDTEMVAEVLEVFAARASAEVSRLRVETERDRFESALRRAHALHKVLTEIQSSFLLDGDTQSTFERLLEPLVALTDSQFGFIGEILYDEAGQPYLKTHVYSNVPWNSASRLLYEEALAKGLEFHNLHSLIGAAISSGKTIIANDAPNDSRRAGLPEGHPVIDSFLGLPVLQGGGLIGMIGIANRQGGYDAEVAAYLEPFLNTCAALITAYRAAQERSALATKMIESENRFRTLADSLPVKVWLADLDGNCIWFNRRWLEFTGRTQEEQIRHCWLEDIHPEDRDSCRSVYGIAFSSLEPVAQEHRLRRHDGEYRTVLVTVAPRCLLDGHVAGYVGACIDLSERRALEAKVQHLAYHDALTDLPNRALLMDRIDQSLARAQRDGNQFAVLFSDFDGFKMINDSLGHSVGDVLLQETGARLRALLRDEDTVARIGGDEFVILLPRILFVREAAHLASRVLAALAMPFSILGHTLHITASIGISVFPQDGLDAVNLLKHADIALHEAKSDGRNSYKMFNPSMNVWTHQRLMVENNLRQALFRDEFLLYYQPRIDLATGRVTGVEALIRWQHPERGLLAPSEFIAVAEEIGLIGEIGRWVLHEACRQARHFEIEGLPLQMAVNVSFRQLHAPDFQQQVEQALSEAELSAACLDLELTESCIMGDPDHVISTLQAIRQLGVQIAIDDFGTGYSSLAYLKRLPVNYLKIDRSFVKGIPEDADDKVIVQTILAMAKSLGLNVVAEGVETWAQRDFLNKYGCDEGQGYLFSRPLPFESVAEYVRASHHKCLMDLPIPLIDM